MFPSKISTRRLADLCRRLSTSLDAGIDARTVWRNEAMRAEGPTARRHFRTISEAVESGADMREALAETGDYFPELLREIAHIGDQTGHLDEAFAELAEHYDFQLKLRRGFLTAIAWPMIELGFAVGVIGLFILALGFVEDMTGQRTDVLGFGLVGLPGLIRYLGFLALVGGAIFGIWWAVRRGLAWTKPIQRVLIRIPGLGTAIDSLALGRLSWALHLTLNSGMDTRRAVALALRTSGNARYTDQIRSVDSWIRQGGSLYEAFEQANVFPSSFLDVLHVGESTGMVVESMKKLADQYREKSEAAMKVLAVVGFFVVLMLVFGILIALIFRIAINAYIGPMYDALEM